MTRNMYWLDVAVGLFEGWWRFDDGRSHAIADEGTWETAFREAGFEEVAMTEGDDTEEGRCMRVLVGFK